jgi:predicted nucleic acid-binding protein
MLAIVDTGPLVAFFDRADRHHRWAVDRVQELEVPLLACEPVLAETMYLLRYDARVPDVLFEYLQNGALQIAFRIEEHVSALRKLLKKYEDTPISLADACVVRMAEIHQRYSVLTLDWDFSVYRKHGRIALPLIHPAG